MVSALKAPTYNNVIRYLGEGTVPRDIMQRRRQTMEVCQRMGTPVLIKHKFNIDDVAKGVAQTTSEFDTTYGQSIYDGYTHGVGFASVETQPGEWIDEEGELQVAKEPKLGWTAAPKYRGYGPGFLTYAIMPDSPEDIWKTTSGGALLHTQQARWQLPWWPFCGDNDLLIICELDANQKVKETYERFQLKMVSPITMRGLDRHGQREFNANAAGNRYWVGQFCEASKALETDPIYQVEWDR